MKRFLLLLLILFAIGACRPGTGVWNSGQADADDAAPLQPELVKQDLQELLFGHVQLLASDALQGREVGSQGIVQAEQYIADTLGGLGLANVPGQEDFFLDFALYRGGYDPDATSLSIRIDEAYLEARPGVDFQPFNFSAIGQLEAELVFAGYGITAPEYRYDDYSNLETEGKIVLLLRHEPQSPTGSDYFQGADLTRHSLFLTKAENALAHGAAGMVLVTDPKSSSGAEDFRLQGMLTLQSSELRRDPGNRQPISALHISQSFAESILGPASVKLEELQERLDREKDPSRIDIGDIEVELSVELQLNSEEIKARNVAAFLEGSDPLLRNEWILVGAHHDHLGSFPGEGDTIFNGADDNASGVAGILALARILSELEPAPRRSIVFATFSAEEQGLLGSREMVARQIPADRIVLMVNLDMIGRNPEQPVQIMGSSFSPDLKNLVQEANQPLELPFRYVSGPEAAVSDYDPFYQRGIPFLFFFTGIHPDYHSTEDHADKLNFPRLADVVELVANTIARAAAKPISGSKVYVDWLGLTVRIGEEQGSMTAEITAVEAGAPAAEFGLLAGDRLLAVDGRVPNERHEVWRSFDGVRSGQSVAVKVLRGQREVEIQVWRAHAGYLGVVVGGLDELWRQQNELDTISGVLIRQVLANGPARRAGLKEGDVLVAVNGTAVSPVNLQDLLSRIGAGTRVELTVLREGERLILPLNLGRRP